MNMHFRRRHDRSQLAGTILVWFLFIMFLAVMWNR